MWGHIAERFLFHVVGSTFATICFFTALRFWVRRNTKVGSWISTRRTHLLITSALLVFALFPLREPYDLIMGNQIWYKTIFDQLSWAVGAGGSAWGLYRFHKE